MKIIDKKKIIGVIAVITVVCVMICIYSRLSWTTSEVKVDITSDGNDSIQWLSFLKHGRENISKQMHSHSPIFSGMGKDSYSFTGVLEYDGIKTKLKTSGYCPRAMCSLDDCYYLIAQNYFKPACFDVFIANKDDKSFKKLPVNINISTLASFDIPGKELNRLFKIWLMRKCLEAGNVQKIVQLFKLFTDKNPVFYIYTGARNRQDNPNVYHEADWNAFPDFVISLTETYADRTDETVVNELVQVIEDILDILPPNNTTNDFGALCVLFIKFDGVRAKKYLTDYFKKYPVESKGSNTLGWSLNWIGSEVEEIKKSGN